MSSIIYQLDIFGHQAKLNVHRHQKTYKTLIGVCFSVVYFAMVIAIIILSISPSVSDLIDEQNKEEKDHHDKTRRNLAELPASTIFT